MSYYILPKINNVININPQYTEDIDINPDISHSLYNYYNQLISQLRNNFLDSSLNCYDEISKMVNPYEYIFSKVPGSKFSVSKLKPKTNIFYDFLEITTSLNIFDPFKNESISSLHISPNYNDTIECLEMLRENFNDEISYFNELNETNIKIIGDIKFDFLFFETKNTYLNEYIISLIEFVMVILRNQQSGGNCVIKISEIFHKPIVEILYFLSSLFEKVYILKPNTSNITTFDKYIICKNFQNNETRIKNYKLNYFRLLVFLKKIEDKKIFSLFDFNVPYYFSMKINDMNIIVGQQQLESLNLAISLFKNKNKHEKIELLKKSHIQKAVLWCEKYKIPCNKFSEKINIFLPIIKLPKEEEEEEEEEKEKEEEKEEEEEKEQEKEEEQEI